MAEKQRIWDYLNAKTRNPYGTAALMGNLMAESSLNPKCVNGINGLKDSEAYISGTDEGKIDFANDGRAFGLVQWCYKTRKQGLLDLAKKKKKSVGDLDLQLEYLWEELKKYKSVYEAVVGATSIRDTSDAVMLKYEKPAITTENARKKRADYAQKFYDEFTVRSDKAYAVAKVDVNVRYGNGKNYSKMGSLKAGEYRECIAISTNGWLAIRFNSTRVGWVSEEFVEIR